MIFLDKGDKIGIAVIIGWVLLSLGVTAGTIWFIVWIVKTIANAIAA